MSINDARVQRIPRHGYPITVLRPDGTVLWSGTPARNQTWKDHAACRGSARRRAKAKRGAVADRFFPEVGRAGVTARRKYCATCDVRAACLESALTIGEEHGIWGGVWAKSPIFRRLRNLRRAIATGRIE